MLDACVQVGAPAVRSCDHPAAARGSFIFHLTAFATTPTCLCSSRFSRVLGSGTRGGTRSSVPGPESWLKSARALGTSRTIARTFLLRTGQEPVKNPNRQTLVVVTVILTTLIVRTLIVETRIVEPHLSNPNFRTLIIRLPSFRVRPQTVCC